MTDNVLTQPAATVASGPVEASTATPAPGTYAIVPAQSAVTFATKHVFGMGTLAGGFAVLGGQIVIGDGPTTSRAEATIDVGSFHSGNARRDKTATSPRFFDAAKHPHAQFRSERIRELTPESWTADGALTIKGSDSPLQIRVDRLTFVGGDLSFHGTAVIDRYAAGIKASKGVPGQMVKLDLTIVAALDRESSTV